MAAPVDEPENKPEPKPEPEPTADCCACGDEKLEKDTVKLDCSHIYCCDCLIELLDHSLHKDSSLFPPRCCKETIPLYMDMQILKDCRSILPRSCWLKSRRRRRNMTRRRRRYVLVPSAVSLFPTRTSRAAWRIAVSAASRRVRLARVKHMKACVPRTMPPSCSWPPQARPCGSGAPIARTWLSWTPAVSTLCKHTHHCSSSSYY
jgi:hypothetical protein